MGNMFKYGPFFAEQQEKRIKGSFPKTNYTFGMGRKIPVERTEPIKWGRESETQKKPGFKNKPGFGLDYKFGDFLGGQTKSKSSSIPDFMLETPEEKEFIGAFRAENDEADKAAVQYTKPPAKIMATGKKIVSELNDALSEGFKNVEDAFLKGFYSVADAPASSVSSVYTPLVDAEQEKAQYELDREYDPSLPEWGSVEFLEKRKADIERNLEELYTNKYLQDRTLGWAYNYRDENKEGKDLWDSLTDEQKISGVAMATVINERDELEKELVNITEQLIKERSKGKEIDYSSDEYWERRMQDIYDLEKAKSLPGDPVGARTFSKITEENNRLDPRAPMRRLNDVSSFLATASLVPGFDTVTDFLSIPVDLARGDFEGAALDVVGMLPIVGEFADSANLARKSIKAVDAIADTGRAFDAADDIYDAGKAIKKSDNIIETATESLDDLWDESIPELPQNPNELNVYGWEDVTPTRIKDRTTSRTFQKGRWRIKYDKGNTAAKGYGGKDHYHILNPNSTGKHDYYLDKKGRPVPKNSKQSHILIGREYNK